MNIKYVSHLFLLGCIVSAANICGMEDSKKNSTRKRFFEDTEMDEKIKQQKRHHDNPLKRKIEDNENYSNKLPRASITHYLPFLPDVQRKTFWTCADMAYKIQLLQQRIDNLKSNVNITEQDDYQKLLLTPDNIKYMTLSQCIGYLNGCKIAVHWGLQNFGEASYKNFTLEQMCNIVEVHGYELGIRPLR